MTIVAILLIVMLVLFYQALEHDYARWDAYDRQEILRDSIVSAGHIELDSFPLNKRDSVRAAIVARSPRATEIRRLEARERQEERVADFYLVATLFSLIAILVFAGYHLTKFWRGIGLDPAVIEARRVRLQTLASVGTTVTLIVLVVFWRFNLGMIEMYRGLQGFVPEARYTLYLTLATAVAVCSVLLVYLLWNLLASPSSRVSDRLATAPKVHRTAVQSTLVAIVALVSASDLKDFVRSEWFLGLQTTGWLSFAVALGSMMMAYLRPRRVRTTGSELQPDFSEREGAAQRTHVPSDAGKRIRRRVRRTLPWRQEHTSQDIGVLIAQVQALAKSIAQTGPPLAQPLQPDEAIRAKAEQMRKRLKEEVEALTARGNLNLIIGIITTLAAATILWLLVLDAPNAFELDKPPQTGEILSYFLPRLSVAVFIEIFSFFFLRLYRNGLADIKYYQNEMTTLESRVLALEIAIMSNRTEASDEILRNLALVDRNMVLRQGETTHELERVRMENQNLRTVVDGLLAKLPSLGGGSGGSQASG
jgi:hypothetical protein